MTDNQKNQAARLRLMGKSYGEIATELGVSINTIKSFCRRSHLRNQKQGAALFCAYCGKEVPQAEHRKPKKYCSDICRMKWWREHSDALNRKSVVLMTCKYCGREFWGYQSEGRKYCSHECYIADRFGGRKNDQETDGG